MSGTNPIVIDRSAFTACADYVKEKHWQSVVLIVDDNTKKVAGDALAQHLEQRGIEALFCMIDPDEQGDVKADEPSLVQALLAISSSKTAALLAVGSGTIHDITRFCSDKTRIPFVSIPTAPSVDGFTSIGAPLTIKGEKKTFKAVSPVALFADINVLMNAPDRLVAAGFGDMVGKFTSLADWAFGRDTAGEPYSEEAAAITKRALLNCVEHAADIGAKTEQGIRVLMDGLIESGKAMLLFGQSHPASGGEHHLSHYWEMAFIKEGRPQVLHGAKVGVSLLVIAKLYKQHQSELPVEEHAAAIPDPDVIKSWLLQVGAPVLPEELGIDESLVKESLQKAYKLRDRHTMLRSITVNGGT